LAQEREPRPELAAMVLYEAAEVSDLESQSEEGRPSWPRSAIFRAFACGVALVCAAAFLSHHHANQHADVSGVQQKDIMDDMWGASANAQSAGSVYGGTASTPSSSAGSNAGYTAGSTAGSTDGYTAGSTAGSTAGYTAGSTAGSTAGYTAGSTAGSSGGAPSEDMNDGNKCEDDEEELAGLCYKKCSLLTNNARPVRISAFSCARSKGFTDVLAADVGTMLPCQGYDISGDQAGNGCPHKHGACLTDEEISLGKCYKKCSVLTNGEYSFRTSATTCCKTHSYLQCMSPGNSKLSTNYNVGGGQGSDASSHAPETKFTESK